MHVKRSTPGLQLLTLGGIGKLPWRPALVASAVSTAALLLLESVLPSSPAVRIGILCGLGLVVSVLSVHSLRRNVPKNDVDQSYVVVDEFLGMLIALAPQMLDDRVRVLPAVVAFGIFRIIDSAKPLGIRQIDALNTPLSVLLDDMVAGIYTAFILAGLTLLMQASVGLS